MDGDELDAILGFPRASGGDPTGKGGLQNAKRFSPRKRG